MFDLKIKEKNAVLVSVNTKKENLATTIDNLEELQFLAYTLDMHTKEKFIQNLPCIHPKTFVGKGKLEQIKNYIKENTIDLAIFDDELSPSQLRNLESELNCEILDRTLLIFQIFAMRAQTNHAKVQVELAQYQYLLPRLKRMWTHLSRQQGGGANMRGPGEKELETDKRIAKDKIAALKEKLESIDRQSSHQRQTREEIVKVALVGYTNVGKSTLLNFFTSANVLAENKLFATLDATVRKTAVKDTPFLLIDTVGFIRKLPHTLVKSFKSTLDHVKEANLLLHIIDISHKNAIDQIKVVEKTLSEIGASDVPRINIYNKIDMISEEELAEKISLIGDTCNSIAISLKNKINIDQFRDTIETEVKNIHQTLYPHSVA